MQGRRDGVAGLVQQPDRDGCDQAGGCGAVWRQRLLPATGAAAAIWPAKMASGKFHGRCRERRLSPRRIRRFSSACRPRRQRVGMAEFRFGFGRIIAAETRPPRAIRRWRRQSVLPASACSRAGAGRGAVPSDRRPCAARRRGLRARRGVPGGEATWAARSAASASAAFGLADLAHALPSIGDSTGAPAPPAGLPSMIALACGTGWAAACASSRLQRLTGSRRGRFDPGGVPARWAVDSVGSGMRRCRAPRHGR